jgi:hypothetical protein
MKLAMNMLVPIANFKSDSLANVLSSCYFIVRNNCRIKSF